MRYNMDRRDREREGEGGYGERERQRERERERELIHTYYLSVMISTCTYMCIQKKSIFIHVAQTIFHGYSKMSLYSMSRPNTLCPV